MKRVLILLTLVLGLPTEVRGQALDWPVGRAGNGPFWLPDQLTIQLDRSTARMLSRSRPRFPARAVGIPSLDRTLAALGGAWLEPEFRGETPPPEGSDAPDFTAFYLVRLAPGHEVGPALERLRGTVGVTGASPIGVVPVVAIPDDSLWAKAYYYFQPSRRDIHAPEAWDLTRGDSSRVVAILDTGVLPYHPDLGGRLAGRRGQIWTNAAEQDGGPGVDDDANGFVDDVQGWDFVGLYDGIAITPGEDWRDADPDPNDFVGHGTAVAGLVGAINDNRIGITGTAWNVRIMPLRVGWSEVELQTGFISMYYLTQAVRYATRAKADVINISSSTLPTPELELAVDEAIAAGITVVVAAGNNGTPHYLGNRPGLIYVCATDRNDQVTVWSNRGVYVDLAAPGAELATTILARPGTDSLGLRQPSYNSSVNGTSFAAPIVSGAAALVAARRRQLGLEPLTPATIEDLLASTCRDIRDVNPGVIGYGTGRLDLERAVRVAPSIRSRASAHRNLGPAIAYHTRDGEPRLAFAAEEGALVLLDGRTLEELRTIPLPAAPSGALAAAGLGGDRDLGIFVPLGHMVAGYGGNGAELPGWPVDLLGDGVENVALGDLDGDGAIEVVACSAYGRVWAFNADGAVRPGFPASAWTGVDAPVGLALADLDASPGVEIVVARRDGAVHALDAHGDEVAGWPVACSGGAPAPPTVLRARGSAVVVVENPTQVCGFAPNGASLFATPRTNGSTPFEPIAVDVNGDGDDELISSSPSGLRVYSADGAPAAAPWPSFDENPLATAPLAGHVDPDRGPALLLTQRKRFLLASPLGELLGALPTFSTVSPALAPPFSSSSTQIMCGTGHDRFYVLDAPEKSWKQTAQPWPTFRGSEARSGSPHDAPRMVDADVRPPAAIADLEGTLLAGTQVMLRWTVPGDDGPRGRPYDYELRVSGAPIAPASPGVRFGSFKDSSPAGEPATARVTVPNRSRWHVALRSRDAAGNWSALSNDVHLSLGLSPAPPRALSVIAADESTMTLRWQPGEVDDQHSRPTFYRIAAGGSYLGEDTFEQAPRHFDHDAAGETWETARIGPFPPGSAWWMAVKALDLAGNVSPVSNTILGRTSSGPPGVRVVQNPVVVPVTFYWNASARSDAAPLALQIHDPLGRLCRRVPLEGTLGGEVQWMGEDDRGRRLPSGVYFVSIAGMDRASATRFVLLR